MARPYLPVADQDSVFAAYRAALQEHWASESPDSGHWWWDVRDSPDSGYDPELWTVAEADADVSALSSVGCTIASRVPRVTSRS